MSPSQPRAPHRPWNDSSRATYRYPLALVNSSGFGKHVLNYVGQLRLYSYVDLVLLLLAVDASALEIVQCSLLWLGFLVFLEWRHRDRGRLRWPWYAWGGLWATAMVMGHVPELLPFFAVAIAYANKKRFTILAMVSPLVNGAIKGALVLIVARTRVDAIVIVTLLTAIRNLAGDFRDVIKDRSEKVATVPVRLGVRRDLPALYPTALVMTSTFWTVWGSLPAWLLAIAVAVQLATYRLTPR